MTEQAETTQQLKARIQHQLLTQIAALSKTEPPQQVSMGTIEPLNFLVNTYVNFMSALTMTFDDSKE